MLYGQQVREAASCVLEEWLKIVHSFYLMRRGSVHQVSAMNRPVTLFRRLWIMVWVWKNLVFLLPSLTQFSRDFWNHRISSLCTSWSYLTCKDFSNWINADVGWTASSMCTFFLEDIAKDIFDEGDRFISKLLELMQGIATGIGPSLHHNIFIFWVSEAKEDTFKEWGTCFLQVKTPPTVSISAPRK